MTTKEVVSEIVGMCEEIVSLKAENEKLRNDIDSLKSVMDKPCETVDTLESNKYLVLKFFNGLTKNISLVKNKVFIEYSLPAVYTNKNDDDDSKYIIPFERWLDFINTINIEDDILIFMSVDEVIELFRNQLKEIYDEKVAKFKSNK